MRYATSATLTPDVLLFLRAEFWSCDQNTPFSTEYEYTLRERVCVCGRMATKKDEEGQFQLISTLRYDPILPEIVSQSPTLRYPDVLRTPYYLLPYHLDRLVRAARHFQWHHGALHRFENDPDAFLAFLDGFVPDRAKQWRLRIVVENAPGLDGIKVEVYPTAPVETPQLLVWPFGTNTRNEGSPVWRIYVDKQQPMEPSGFTMHKTTAREGYTAARVRAGIMSPQEQAEVLVVNPDGQVMEGSITTPYFWRPSSAGSDGNGDGEWVTPPLSCGGNAGTTRRYALAQGFCSERVISAAELVDGEGCWISNGVRGFMRGVVCS